MTKKEKKQLLKEKEKQVSFFKNAAFNLTENNFILQHARDAAMMVFGR